MSNTTPNVNVQYEYQLDGQPHGVCTVQPTADDDPQGQGKGNENAREAECCGMSTNDFTSVFHCCSSN